MSDHEAKGDDSHINETFVATPSQEVSRPHPYHSRSDSSFSMDSFVVDVIGRKDTSLTLAAEDSTLALDETANRGDFWQGDGTSDGFGTQLSPPKPQQQETIDRVRANSVQSYDSNLPPPPAHPFFHTFISGNESDGQSDGSVVFNSPLKIPAPEAGLPQQSKPATPKGRQDRFPSFDSAGSSGSVVKKTVPTPRSTNVAQPGQKILPYNERRKLMQMRQTQQDTQQQQPKRDQTPPRPEMQQQQQHRAVHLARSTPPAFVVPHTPPQPPGYVSNNPSNSFVPFHPVHMQPFGMMPPPPPSSYPYPQPMMMHQMLPFPPNTDYRQVLDNRQQPPAQLSYLPQQSFERMSHGNNPSAMETPPFNAAVSHGAVRPQHLQPSMEESYPRPPTIQNLSPYYHAASRPSHEVGDPFQSSSYDSSDGVDIRPSQLHGNGVSLGSDSRHSKPKTPPPPPPPPPIPRESPRPPSLIRQDSAGSVSSLGSLDRSGRDDGSRSRRPTFFQRLNPWATSPKEHNVDDFHRKNQAFLSKVERSQGMYSPSPRQIARRMPLNSMVRPPPSHGNHRRLNSIENDDWSEKEEEVEKGNSPLQLSSEGAVLFQHQHQNSADTNQSQSRAMSHMHSSANVAYKLSSDGSDQDSFEANEQTRLLPPTGISTYESADKLPNYKDDNVQTGRLKGTMSHFADAPKSRLRDNGAIVSTARVQASDRISRKSRRKRKKRRQAARIRRRSSEDSSDSSSDFSQSSSSYDYPCSWSDRDRVGRNVRQNERPLAHKSNRMEPIRNGDMGKLFRCFARAESFFANLPLTIGAIALSIASLGVVWFKFAEENMVSCIPVHFHSAQCTFPEFPGCFYCDTSARMYKVAAYFHFSCSFFAGVLALSFVAKLLLARQVVFAELSSPTTASPAGLLCMTLDVVFAGRGFIGMVIVSSSSFIHLCLAIWFLYLAMAYHTMPEPSWFPSTSGLGVSAVKTYLYFPIAGHFLMAVSLSLTFVFFPISLIRVYFNRKISATVGWMQMSAPNVALYAVTIMVQPSFEEENPDINQYQRLHRRYYLPFMSFLFGLCLLGAVASVHSLIVRWNEFRKLPFSPAHAAFCAPALSHCNAVQAYRAAVLSFSGLSNKSHFLRLLYSYWTMVLISSTLVTLCISTMFLISLPKWTHFDLEDEIEPPAPYETAMSLSHMLASGETLVQPFISPAILQANETGTLVLTRDSNGEVRYRRTRKITALGFEPLMDDIEIDLEREFLLDWVASNTPRVRGRTLSVPGIGFRHDGFGSGNSGVYRGLEEGIVPRRRSDVYYQRRGRSFTESPHVR